MRRRRFVIPDVRAAAVTASALVVRALEAVKLAVAGAEANLCDECRKIRAGGVFDRSGNRGFAKGGSEAAGLGFQSFQIGSGVLGSDPGVWESSGVVIADDGVLVAFRSGPAAAAWRCWESSPSPDAGCA